MKRAHKTLGAGLATRPLTGLAKRRLTTLSGPSGVKWRVEGALAESVRRTGLAVCCVLVGGLLLSTAPAFAAPEKPVTEAATAITSTTAMLHGELNPHSEASTGYYFAYNTTGACTAGGTSEPGAEAEKVKALKVSTPVTGLEPNKQYTFCLVATHLEGETTETASGAPLKFKTLTVPPEVVAESEHASALSPSEVRFEGVVNPNNQPTKCDFQYGSDSSLAASTTVPCESATLEGYGGQGAGVNVSGLEADATYYYRVVTENENAPHEKVDGAIEAFSKPPVVEGESSSGLTSTSVKLEGTVNPDFQETTYAFEYAESEAALGTPQASTIAGEAPLPAELTGLPVSTQVSGLTPDHLYYYRLIAENATSVKAGKPVTGAIQSFQALAAPILTTGEAQSITRTTAALSGTVNAAGAETSYSFAYISEAGYQAALAKGAANPYSEGETTASLSAGSSYETQAVGPVLASGLLPDTTYHYAVIARNGIGGTIGSDGTFTTLPATPPQVSTGGSSNISQNSATLSGTVDTNSLQTEYGFEIATEAGNYGPATGLGSLGGALTETVMLTLSELQPGTTYYYRVTATNGDGTTHGEPRVFTTPGFPILITLPTVLPQLPVPAIAFPATAAGGAPAPVITVVRHSVSGSTARIVVRVPSAGKLTAAGSGVSKATGKSSGAADITLRVTLSKGEQMFLARHHNRMMMIRVRLTFAPKGGGVLTASLTVLIG